MRRDGTTRILSILVALAVLLVLVNSSPRAYVAAGAAEAQQAPGDNPRPTLDATRMPLTMLPVQTARAELTTTARPPTAPATTTVATPTPSPTTVFTSTTTQPTPTPTTTATVTARATATATASASVTPFTTATALPNAAAAPPDMATSTTPGYSVTHVPTRAVPRQHLPTAGGGADPVRSLPTLLVIALLCVGGGWMLLMQTRR